MSLTTTTENLRLEGNHIIKARCKVGPCGHFVDATFDLDSCLGNGNGKDYSLNAPLQPVASCSLTTVCYRKL